MSGGAGRPAYLDQKLTYSVQARIRGIKYRGGTSAIITWQIALSNLLMSGKGPRILLIFSAFTWYTANGIPAIVAHWNRLEWNFEYWMDSSHWTQLCYVMFLFSLHLYPQRHLQHNRILFFKKSYTLILSPEGRKNEKHFLSLLLHSSASI